MSLSLVRPSMIRPTIYALPCRPFFQPAHIRAFSCSARYQLEAGRTQHASTALKTSVRNREERSGASEQMVGDEVIGAEGPHYKDQMPSAVATANPLTDLTRTGAWTLMNPIYTERELESVKVVHRAPVTVSDKLDHSVVRLLRRAFDLFTGYKETVISPEVLAQRPLPVEELRAKGQLLGVKQWMLRIILLESIAGVPGMVGGTLRHLRSLRLLRRDGGWIHTLLEEAENERMHLLTFMAVAQPSLFTRALVLGAQGVFYNVFFLTYLFSPKTAHRFVGALEEEAVRTYTHCIDDIEAGLVPEWIGVPAPRIAIDYWRLPANAVLLDVVKAVRADEATHRFVNHSLANLKQNDFNPFAMAEASAEVRGTTYGFTREESADFARKSHEALMEAKAEVEEAKEKQIAA